VGVGDEVGVVVGAGIDVGGSVGVEGVMVGVSKDRVSSSMGDVDGTGVTCDTVGGCDSWVGGGVTDALELQPSSIISIRTLATKTPRFIIAFSLLLGFCINTDNKVALL
jgi:hypothetical protein